MSVLKQILPITSGTGRFGHTVLRHFLHTDIGKIRVFSRDEKKQDDMRHKLQMLHPDHAKKLFFPMEAVQTNVGETNNILHAAIEDY